MEKKKLPQYIRVARKICTRIVDDIYTEGQRLPGLSTLSSLYNVSPETVRKALRLLDDMHIVKIKEGSGTKVLSKEKAEEYLDSISVRQEHLNLSNELRTLYQEYEALGKQMIQISSQLVSASAIPVSENMTLPNYEVVVPENSDKIGLTIGELRFWQSTGATIVGIKHNNRITISPGPYSHIHKGDTIIYVGAPSCKEAVEHLLFAKGQRTLYSMQDQILQAIHASELRVIATALDARLSDLKDFEPLVKGMTNRSFLFTCKNHKYILRIPGEGTHSLINRAEEADVYRAIKGHDLCDDNVYLNPKNGLKVAAFLENARSCDPYNSKDIARVIKLLRKFHNLKLKVNHSFDIMEKIDLYESLWDGNDSKYPDYKDTKEKVKSLIPFVDSCKKDYCLTHIDAVPDNFLFYTRDGEEQLQLTDWEYAAMQDPHVDIAMFCIYSGYQKNDVDDFIDKYFNNKCDKQIRKKIYCYISMCGLLWSNWCEYKSFLGVEFGDYAQSQYSYAKDYYEIAMNTK